MRRILELKKKLKVFEREGLFTKKFGMHRLISNFQEKSRHNLLTARTIWELSKEAKAKDVLKLPADFNAYDWVVVAGYYSMYHSALAALAAIDYKSDNHTATVVGLEYFFVHKQKLLEWEYTKKLEKTRRLEEEYIMKIARARRDRETAQYSATDVIEEEMTDGILRDAAEFIARIDQLVEELKQVEVK